MEYQIAVCDDEKTEREYLQSLVRDWARDRSFFVQVKTYASAEEFLFQYEEEKALDILLLDIEMGVINGVELARELRRGNERIQIVFITGYPDFMAEGYEVDALHYLLKPVSSFKLGSVLDKAVKNLGKKERYIFLTVDGEERLIPVCEILYVEAFAHSAVLVLTEGEAETRDSISELETLLGKDFIRCHRSYLVNLSRIRRITRTDVILEDDVYVPLSRRLYHEVNRVFIQYNKGE